MELDLPSSAISTPDELVSLFGQEIYAVTNKSKTRDCKRKVYTAGHVFVVWSDGVGVVFEPYDRASHDYRATNLSLAVQEYPTAVDCLKLWYYNIPKGVRQEPPVGRWVYEYHVNNSALFRTEKDADAWELYLKLAIEETAETDKSEIWELHHSHVVDKEKYLKEVDYILRK